MSAASPSNYYHVTTEGIYYLRVGDFYIHIGKKPSGERYLLCDTCGDLHEESYMAHCQACGIHHLSKSDLCWQCHTKKVGSHAGPYVSIEVGAEDSQDPRRVADGTSWINAGLPGVETVIGMRRDGKPQLEYRPISNNELATARTMREYAKTHGLEPKHTSIKRALGGR